MARPTKSPGCRGGWSTVTPDNAHEYGAAATDFDREDILTTKNVVDLAKSDGGPGSWILGTDLYQLTENTLRGGASSKRYLLEDDDEPPMSPTHSVDVKK